MVVLSRRSRLVTFRVSTDEYDTLRKSCLECGARSVAEFSRSAVLQTVEKLHIPGASLSGDLATLSEDLRELDLILADMRKRIRGVLGPSRSSKITAAGDSSGAE
jgi:hypothetical protein